MQQRKIKLGAGEGYSRGALILSRIIETSSEMVSLMRRHLHKDLKELKSKTWVYPRNLCR